MIPTDNEPRFFIRIMGFEIRISIILLIRFKKTIFINLIDHKDDCKFIKLILINWIIKILYKFCLYYSLFVNFTYKIFLILK